MNNFVKVTLALLLFICLMDLPYGYYQFLRLAALVGFGFLSYVAKDHEKKTEMVIYVCLAVTFQPLMKISLGREIWNFVDVIVGIGLILSIFSGKININEK